MLPIEKLRIEQVDKSDGKVIHLKGTIDEDSNFSTLVKMGVPLRLNFSGVTSINSCGIRTWVNFLKDMGAQQVVYEACPPLIVRQMNMVPSFVGKAKVESVFVPFVCAECEAEKNLLVTLNDFKAGKIPGKFPCEACKKGEMEFDGQPKQYFAFSK